MYFVNNTKLMRTIAIIGFILMLIGLCPILAGCGSPYEDSPDKDKTWVSHGELVTTKVAEIEGHKYIIMVGFKCGGIIHAESCSCKK